MNRRTIISAPEAIGARTCERDRAAVRAATQRRGSSTFEQSELWLLAARDEAFRAEQGRQRRREFVRTAIIACAFFGAWYVPQLAVWMLGGAR